MPTIPAIESEIKDRPELQSIPEIVEYNILQVLKGLQFGEVTITVQNGSVTQIERVARKRQFKSSSRG